MSANTVFRDVAVDGMKKPDFQAEIDVLYRMKSGINGRLEGVRFHAQASPDDVPCEPDR